MSSIDIFKPLSTIQSSAVYELSNFRYEKLSGTKIQTRCRWIRGPHATCVLCGPHSSFVLVLFLRGFGHRPRQLGWICYCSNQTQELAQSQSKLKPLSRCCFAVITLSSTSCAQMRLCLATKDYIRTQIISKKISVRFFEKDQHQELKLKFYQYMIELDQVLDILMQRQLELLSDSHQ